MKTTLIILTTALLSSLATLNWSKQPISPIEQINSLEDMKSWLEFDQEEGRIDSLTADSYLITINTILQNQ